MMINKIKNKKIFKSIFAISLILCINASTFAAVGANDGSAFITKAEFDALVNTFNEQMDTYENSLGSKIDGAIANYLASLDDTATVQLNNMIESASNASVKNVQFMKWVKPQETKDVYDVTGAFSYDYVWGLTGNNASTGRLYGYVSSNNSGAWNGGMQDVRYTNYTGNTDDYTSAYYYANFPYKSKKNFTDWTLENVKRKRLHFDLKCGATIFLWDCYSGNVDSAPYSSPNSYTFDYTEQGQPSMFSQKNGLGNIYMAGSPTPWSSITHLWEDYEGDADEKNNECLEYNIGGAIDGEDKMVDYELRDYYDITQTPVNIPIQKTKPSTGNYGGNSGSQLAMHFDRSGTHYNFYSYKGVNQCNNNVTYNFKFPRQTIYTLKWDKLTSSYWNGIMQKPIYKFNGIPITNVTKEGVVKMKLTLNNTKSGAYTYCIADIPFNNETIPESMKIDGNERILLRGAVSRSGDEVIDVALNKKKIYDRNNGDYLYLKIEPSVAGHIVTAKVEELYEIVGGQ